MFKKIVKRDGKIVDFNLDKITDAIAKAGAVTEEFKHDRAAQLSEKVLKLQAHRQSLYHLPTGSQ